MMTMSNIKKEVLSTYIMMGDTKSKELETYHLILAANYSCNLSCPHCYLPNHSNVVLPLYRILTLIDEWSEIVEYTKGQFGGIFHLKGGEPLMLPYFHNVIEKLAEVKILQFMMTTNGTFYNSRTVEELSNLNEKLHGNVTINVSLDGSTEEVNSILRQPGNFKKTTTFARLISESGINLFFNYVIHRHNLDDIQDFLEFALELGATQVNFLSFVPKGYGAKLADYRPNPIDVFNRIQGIWLNGDKKIKEMLAGSLNDIIDRVACEKCTAIECVGGYKGLFYIEPNGNVYSCPNLNFPHLKIGNILESSCAKLMSLLTRKVYKKIRTFPGKIDDSFLCKGEKFLPNSTDFLNNKFEILQKELG